MKKLIVITLLYTGCIWGQDDVSIRDIKKELKSLKEITLRVSTNNDRMLLSYLDNSIPQNSDLVEIEKNFYLMDSLYSVLMAESLSIISYNIKKKQKQKFLSDLASLRENLLKAIMTQKESYSYVIVE